MVAVGTRKCARYDNKPREKEFCWRKRKQTNIAETFQFRNPLLKAETFSQLPVPPKLQPPAFYNLKVKL